MTTVPVSSPRIDTPIKPSSALRLCLVLVLAFIVILLALLAPLSVWQYGLLIVISALVISFAILSQPILLHLSQPPIHLRYDQQWQLLMRTGRGDELWRGHLVAVHRYTGLISFEFTVVEPYQRALSVTVFRDQVSVEHWRELNVLATVAY